MIQKCTNLINCPICNEADTHELISYELNMIFSIRCAQCGHSYGDIMEPESRLGECYISQTTYERVCGIWQQGACNDRDITYIPLQFD